MLITKFNKMIRNRIVWWIIGGIVIITFVGWFSPRGSCETLPAANAAGTLNGEPVTDSELRQARFNTYLGLCLMVGRIIPMTEEVDAELRDQAWKRVAALRAAKAMGITASADEVRNLLVRDPQFSVNGQFNRERYDQFRRNVLGALNTTVTQFEQQLAENIVLQKLQNLTQAAAWVAPSEMQRIVARYADSFSVEYVTLGPQRVEKTVSLAEDEIRAYFEANTNRFVIPEMVAVKYVSYDISNYLARASTDSQAVEEYYDTHAEEFTTTDTNGTSSVTPIESVRDSISNKLLYASATELARNAAYDLVVALAPARDGTASSFEQVTDATGLTVRTTALFDAADGPKEFEPSPLLIEAAFRLRPTPDEYFSDAVQAGHRVYVMALLTNTEARIPEFAEVKAKVEPLAREKAVADKLAKVAADLRDRCEAGIKAGKTFRDIVKNDGLTVSTSGVFSAYSAPDALSEPGILEDITTRESGEMSAVLTTTNGLIVAHVAERKPASMDETAAVRAQLGTSVARRRTRTLFGEWQDALIRKGLKLHTGEPARPTRDEPPIVD